MDDVLSCIEVKPGGSKVDVSINRDADAAFSYCPCTNRDDLLCLAGDSTVWEWRRVHNTKVSCQVAYRSVIIVDQHLQATRCGEVQR